MMSVLKKEEPDVIIVNRKIKFLVGKKGKRQADGEVVIADIEKLKHMTPALNRMLAALEASGRMSNFHGKPVDLRGKCCYAKDIFKLIVEFSENGSIVCPSSELISRFAFHIKKNANKNLLSECHRLVENVLSPQNIWKMIRSLDSSYIHYKVYISKILAENPDACVQSLDLRFICYHSVQVVNDLGTLRDKRSPRLLALALQKMPRRLKDKRIKTIMEFIQAVKKKFPIVANFFADSAKSAKSLEAAVRIHDVCFTSPKEFPPKLIPDINPKDFPPKLTPDIEKINPFNQYPDANDDVCQVKEVPLLVKLEFQAETDLCFVGFELLSRSPMPIPSSFPKRPRLELIYVENLDVRVDVCYGETERNILEMKINGSSTLCSSTMIHFEDEVFVPKGFNCRVHLRILDACWYQKLTKPALTGFYSQGGQLLVNKLHHFQQSIAGENVFKVCPISKIFLRPIASDCILLQH